MYSPRWCDFVKHKLTYKAYMIRVGLRSNIPYWKRPTLFYCSLIWACICKPFKEPRNQFPAWRADTTSLFDVSARQATLASGIDSWSPSTFTNLGSGFFWLLPAITAGTLTLLTSCLVFLFSMYLIVPICKLTGGGGGRGEGMETIPTKTKRTWVWGLLLDSCSICEGSILIHYKYTYSSSDDPIIVKPVP